MSVKEKVKEMIGSSLVEYDKLNVDNKTNIDQLKFTEEYQNRIISCMVSEVDDNYIETPETDSPIVKLENSREGLVKVTSLKGKTVLVDVDGNETDTPAEGCKLVSVGEEEDNKLIILSKNKNLLNKDDSITSSYYGSEVTMIRVKPNTTYKYTSYPYIGHISIFYLKDYVDYTSTTNMRPHSIVSLNIQSGQSFTTTEETKYIFLNFGETSDVQVEEGTISTTYTPHQSHKTEILLNEPLRSLPNGVCDERIGNRLIRRVGRVLFDGSVDEKWGNGGWSNNSRIELYRKDEIFNSKHEVGFCDTIKVIPNIITDNIVEGVVVKTNAFSIFLPINKLNGSDVKDALLYLSENPIEVLYELAEPIIEELPNGITLQGFDDTTMYLENKITPTVTYGYNALIPFKEGAIAQGKKSKANAQDIDESIIPFMMDIEYQILTL